MEFKSKIVDAFKYLDRLVEDVEKGKPIDPVKCNATVAEFLFDVKGKFKVIAEKFEFIKEKLKGKPLAMLLAKLELKAQDYLEGFQSRWMTFSGIEQALLLNQKGILELFRNTIKQGKDDSTTLYESIKSWAEEIMEGKLFYLNLNPFGANFTKSSNTLRQLVGNLPTNCLSVFDHFVGLVLKRLITLAVNSVFMFFYSEVFSRRYSLIKLSGKVCEIRSKNLTMESNLL